MRGMIGCAAIIAVPAFVLGLIIALLLTEASLAERLMIPPMIAVIVFIAALACFGWDYARHTRTRRVVRRALLKRGDVDDDDFAAHFPDVDATLIAQTRRAVAEFFDVPATQVHPTDKLIDDMHFEALEPSFHSFVVYRVLNVRNVDVVPQWFQFNTGGLNDIGDLAGEIQRVLDRLDYGDTGD